MSESRSSVHIDVVPGREPSFRPVAPGEAFRILIAGDFSGRSNRRAGGSLRGRPVLAIDRDNLDDVIAGLSPQLHLPGITLRFGEVEDFHPDRIYREPAFQALVERLVGASPAVEARPVRNPAPPPAGLLDQIVGEDPAGRRPAKAEDANDLAEFLKRVTAAHVVQRPDERQERRRAEAGQAASALMSAILHHPDFQTLESAWRAVELLIRRLDTDGALKLYVLDATREEIEADPEAWASLLSRPDAPWALCLGNYVFGRSPEDLRLLNALGRAAERAGCSVIAEADAASVSDSNSEWDRYRASPEARWIGLALPRFLLRLPYGPNTSPVESFDYDEMPESRHADYLWGNPAFCCGYLLGMSFLEDGWELRPGSHREVSGLPLHVYSVRGETELKPCAEVLMQESEAEFLLDQGIMPLASLKGQDAALLVRFQSVAKPPRPLNGRWNPA
jgi:type VI secretion system protein ImpC